VSGIPATTPQYDRNSTSVMSFGNFNLHSDSNLLGGYRTEGIKVYLNRPNHFFIDVLQGITDFNVNANTTDGQEAHEFPV
jgi:hypothetical protein